MKRREEWEAAYRAVVYDPDAERPVLRNKFGITDFHRLEEFERAIVVKRQEQGFPDEALKPTAGGLKATHYHLFQDIYDWAGEYRSYPTSRGGGSFSLPDHISGHVDNTLKQFRDENCLKGFSPENFSARAAHYVNEINVIHPFIDGNGRVQRAWLSNVADGAGYQVAFRSEDRAAWNKMSMLGRVTADNPEQGYRANNPMRDLIHSRLEAPGQSLEKPDQIYEALKQYLKAADRIEQTIERGQDRDDGQER